jgi:dynein heavy chain
MGVQNATASTVLDERLENLNSFFTYSLYENVCRSLFEKHKLLFSFLLTKKVLSGSNNMNEDEWRFLLTGATGDIQVAVNPTTWISEN